MTDHQPHLTNAQYRMLGHAWTQQPALDVTRYLATGPTIAALLRKGCIARCTEMKVRAGKPYPHRTVWVQTERGRKIHQAHGRNPVAS